MRTAFGKTFAGSAGFLDTATYGLPPQFLTRELRRWLGEWELGRLNAAGHDEAVTRARTAFASLTGTDVDQVAMGGSVSALVGIVAASLRANSRIAVLPREFTSLTFPFAAQGGRGITLHEVPSAEDLCSPGWDVVAVSVVQSADGSVVDLEALRAAHAGTDTLVVLDVTQAAGWMDLHLDWADVVVGAGYKWLLAPRGIAWAAFSERIRSTTVPMAANWYAGTDPWSSVYGLPMRLAESGRSFDASPAWFSALGAGLVMPWLASLDMALISAHTVGLANTLRKHSHMEPSPSPIVSLPEKADHMRMRAAGIRAAQRAGAVRVAFHLYNDESDLDLLISAIT